jgi:hypothetical protein
MSIVISEWVRDWMKHVVTFSIQMVLDIVIAIAIGRLIGLSIWKSWLAIQLIKFMYWAIKSLINFISLISIWEKKLVNETCKYFYTNNYPNRSKYVIYSNYVYTFFKSVMFDEELNIGTRLNAAVSLGQIEAQSGILTSWHIKSLTEKAIKKYHLDKYGGKKYQGAY